MKTSEEKLLDWLNANPEGYYELPMKDIASASGTSIAAVSQILPRLIAEREGIMPTDVKQKRFSNTQGRIDRKRLWELVDKGLDVADIASLLKCSEGSVREIIRKEQPPAMESEADESNEQ